MMFWRGMYYQDWEKMPFYFWWLFIPLALWELIFKGVALWKSAQNKQKGWFIAVLVINSIGILPIIYLLFFSKKKK